jgi:hypothetical protein
MHNNLTIQMARTELSKSDQKKLIKVAILDTGCDLSHPKIVELNNARRGKQIAEFKDFVDEKATSMRDNAGHGTFLTHIFLKVIRFAKVYVIRVFDRIEADQETVSRIDKVGIKSSLFFLLCNIVQPLIIHLTGNQARC